MKINGKVQISKSSDIEKIPDLGKVDFSRKFNFNPNNFIVSGDTIFATKQGEGLLIEDGGTAGCPAVFFRLHFCNLKCGKNSGWKCDTSYTWDTDRQEYWSEPIQWTTSEAAENIKNLWQNTFGDLENEAQQRRVVITGGEPLLQQEKIVKLLKSLPEWHIEIETNGTITPLPELSAVQFNCSPKLANSGNELTISYRPNVLKNIASLPNVWFKFVVVTPTDLKEIDTIVKDCNLPKNRVLIMAEGHTKEAVSAKEDLVGNLVNHYGWRIAHRNHLTWYGPKRRT